MKENKGIKSELEEYLEENQRKKNNKKKKKIKKKVLYEHREQDKYKE